MSTYEFSVPCLFGLEGIAGDELRRLDIPNVRVENGRVLFSGEARDMAKANICLRTGERVLIVLADFPAKTFEELFQGVYHANLEDFIPKDGSFPVKGHCLNSQLMSVPDCQAIVKKAASRRLGEKYGVSWLPETGAKYQLQFSIMNDRVQLYLDTSGQGLHKRGYRAVGNDAPLRETLAAAMVQLTRYRGREFLWDPFCGSGTIPIEAALIARNAAPGGGSIRMVRRESLGRDSGRSKSEGIPRKVSDPRLGQRPQVRLSCHGQRPEGGGRRHHPLRRRRRHQNGPARPVRHSHRQPALRPADAGAAECPAALRRAGAAPEIRRRLEEIHHHLRTGV